MANFKLRNNLTRTKLSASLEKLAAEAQGCFAGSHYYTMHLVNAGDFLGWAIAKQAQQDPWSPARLSMTAIVGSQHSKELRQASTEIIHSSGVPYRTWYLIIGVWAKLPVLVEVLLDSSEIFVWSMQRWDNGQD